jgi:hypothetical protein
VPWLEQERRALHSFLKGMFKGRRSTAALMRARLVWRAYMTAECESVSDV